MELRYMVSRSINHAANFKKFATCSLEIKYRTLFYFSLFNKNLITKWGAGETLCVHVIKVTDVKIYVFTTFTVFYGEKLKSMYTRLLGY